MTSVEDNTNETEWIGLRRHWREDRAAGHQSWRDPGFRAVAVYRFGVWVGRLRSRVLRAILRRVYHSLYRYVRNHYGIELYRSTKIGRRFLIGHQNGVVIHPKAVFGDDCLIRHNVTIGAASGERVSEAPKLGNRVEVGVGAVLIGGITIGDDVRIGPGSIVMTNVPAGARVFANPARVLPPAKKPQPSEAVSS